MTRHALILLAFLFPAAAAGQMQGQARAIASYWREISDARSIAEARGVERPPNVGGFRDREIADGLLRLREYELTYDRATALKATRILQHVVDVHPEDPWAHYALGAMLARGPDVRQRTYRERNVYVVFSLGTLAAIHAPQELRKALTLDPLMNVAAIELGQLAMDFNDRSMMRDAFNALDREGMTVTSAGLLMQSELSKRLGASAQAAKLAELASVAGFDASVASYHRAAAGFYRNTDVHAASRAYFEGIDSLTAAGADLYYSSISLLLTPDELTTWRNATLPQQRDFLRKFWDMRAALAGVTVERRIAEHFKRLSMLEPYRSAKISATPTALSLRSGPQPTLAEKNATLLNIMRHGDPSRAAKFKSCAPGWDTLPVPMQPSLRECESSSYARSHNWHHGACPALPVGLWISPMRMDSFLVCKASGGVPDEIDLIAMRGFTYAASKQSVKGESYYPAYANPVAFTWEAYQFRGINGGSEIVAAVGVMNKSIAALTAQNGDFNAIVTLTLADTVNDSVARSTTSFLLDPSNERGNPDGYVLLHTNTLAKPADAVAMRIAVENRDATAGAIAYGHIDISAFPADSLTMSDVIVAPSDAGASFKRGDVSLALAPGRIFKRTEKPTLYYETYGLDAGTSVTTTINLRRIRGTFSRIFSIVAGDSPDLSLRFTETAQPPHPQFGEQASRTVDLNTLESGAYTMTITVTDARNRTTTKTRLLVIE